MVHTVLTFVIEHFRTQPILYFRVKGNGFADMDITISAPDMTVCLGHKTFLESFT